MSASIWSFVAIIAAIVAIVAAHMAQRACDRADAALSRAAASCSIAILLASNAVRLASLASLIASSAARADLLADDADDLSGPVISLITSSTESSDMGATSNFVLGRQCCRVTLHLLHNIASLVSTRTACLLAIQGLCCTEMQY